MSNKLVQWYVSMPWQAALCFALAFFILVLMVIAAIDKWRDPLAREKRDIRRRIKQHRALRRHINRCSLDRAYSHKQFHTPAIRDYK